MPVAGSVVGAPETPQSLPDRQVGPCAAPSDPGEDGRSVWPSVLILPLDQLVYAATNFLPVLLLAQVSTADSFGRLALSQGFIVALAVLGRAYFGTPLVAQREPISALVLRTRLRQAAVVGAIGLAGMLAMSTASSLPLADPMDILMLGAGLPFAFLVEVFRSYFVTVRHELVTLAVDVVWLAAQAATVILGYLVGFQMISVAKILWSVGAAISGLMAILLLSLLQRGKNVRNGSAPSRAVSRGFLVEAALLAARINGYYLILAIVAGYSMQGSIRYAVALTAPVNTAFIGLRTFLTRCAVYRGSLSPRLIAGSLGLGVVLVVFGVAIPASVVDAIDGDTSADRVFIYVAAAVALTGIDIIAQSLFAAGQQLTSLRLARVFEVGAWFAAASAGREGEPGRTGAALLMAATASTVMWVALWQRGRVRARCLGEDAAL